MSFKSLLKGNLVLSLCFGFCVGADLNPSFPKSGFVPDEKTAIAIAVAIWLPIYGDHIFYKKPFVAKLDSTLNKWIVKGSITPKNKGEVLYIRGGVPYIEINKKTAEVLRVIHGK